MKRPRCGLPEPPACVDSSSLPRSARTCCRFSFSALAPDVFVMVTSALCIMKLCYYVVRLYAAIGQRDLRIEALTE
jgi:hypothetical protein